MLDPTVMRRLSFIKYLYETGVEQSRRPEPMNAVSLLTFHDSIELFLRLASEQKDAAAKTDLKFLDYWDVLKHKVQGGLTQKESVRRLDSARGNLKHQGTRPSKEDVEEYRVTAKRFFEDNTPLVFDVPFADVSMIKIVQPVIARKTLEEAEELIEKRNVKEALLKLKMAFDQVIGNSQEQTGFGVQRMRRVGHLDQRMYNFLYKSSVKDKKVQSLFGDVIKEIDILRNQVSTLLTASSVATLGLDYQRYAKFSELTGPIKRNVKGEYIDVSGDYPDRPTPSVEDCYFCLDFVVEGAIRIQSLGLNSK